MNIRGISVAGSILAFSLFSIGCGSSSNSGTTFTQAQAMMATADLFAAMAEAPQTTGHVMTPAHAYAEAIGIRHANLNSAQVVPSIEAENLLAASREASPKTTLPTFTFNCPSGGTIVVNGSFTETTTGTTFSSTMDMVETINNCSDHGFTMNGDPNVTIVGTDTLSGNIDTDVVAITGGITVGSNSCSINETITGTFNSATATESGSVSGSICGVSVNSTF